MVEFVRKKRPLLSFFGIESFFLSRFSCRKYADAKRCAKNATLSMCNVTQEQLDDVDFIYDKFNPFCSQSVDPPIQDVPSEKEGDIPRDFPGNNPKEPVASARRQEAPNEGNFIGARPCSYLLVVSVILFMAAIS